MQKLFRTIPHYFWFFTVWCISKVFQVLLKHDKTIWEVIWEKSLTLCDNDEFKLFVYGIVVVGSIANTSLIVIFCIFDFTQKPAFIRKYKVNPQTNEPPDLQKFKKALNYSGLLAVTVVIPTFILTFYGLRWRGIPNIHVLPNIQTVLISCFIKDHVIDIGTYTFHRLLHHRLFYKHFHKMHHEYKSTIVAAVFYISPIDQLFSNMIPLGLGIIIMRCHIATTWISIISIGMSSAINHSGYHLPFLSSPEFHDFHHVKFDSNYSGFGLMDWIFGTDDGYRNSVFEKRDRVLLSSKSAHELYPMDKNKKIK